MKLVDTQVTWSGRTLSLKGWAKQLDLPYDALRVRYQRGLRGDKLFKPLSKAVLMRGSKVRDYSNRKNNPALKADYETTYSNYRTATVSVQMEVLAPKNLIQQVAEGEYVVSVVSGYGAEITWSRRRKRKRNGGGGGGRRGKMERFPPMPKFVGRKINCPNF